MAITTIGQAVFAATFIALGILGLASGDFAPIWGPMPKDFPAREFLVWICALVPLASGVGLLFRRTFVFAARLLLALLVLWLTFIRVRVLVASPGAIDSWFGVAEISVYLVATWAFYDEVTGKRRMRVATVLYALCLLLFGIAHFIYINETASLVPGWLPAHLAFAYITGATYIAASAAVASGVKRRLAAILAAWQMGGFTVLVWFPIVTTGAPSPFTWSEFVVSIALTSSAWVIAEAYRGRSVELRA